MALTGLLEGYNTQREATGNYLNQLDQQRRAQIALQLQAQQQEAQRQQFGQTLAQQQAQMQQTGELERARLAQQGQQFGQTFGLQAAAAPTANALQKLQLAKGTQEFAFSNNLRDAIASAVNPDGSPDYDKISRAYLQFGQPDKAIELQNQIRQQKLYGSAMNLVTGEGGMSGQTPGQQGQAPTQAAPQGMATTGEQPSLGGGMPSSTMAAPVSPEAVQRQQMAKSAYAFALAKGDSAGMAKATELLYPNMQELGNGTLFDPATRQVKANPLYGNQLEVNKFAEGVGGDVAKYADKLNNTVSTLNDEVQRIGVMKQAAMAFQPGASADLRLMAAKQLKDSGFNSLAEKVMRGSPADAQLFNKLAAGQAMQDLKSAVEGGKITQSEFQIFRDANPSISLDPDAINKVFDFVNQRRDLKRAEQNAFSSYIEKGGRPGQWQNTWSQQVDENGLLKPQAPTQGAQGQTAQGQAQSNWQSSYKSRAAAVQDALEAVNKGASREAVRQRLQQIGITDARI